MKLISKPLDLTREFKRLTKKYCSFKWAVAWASSGSEIFEELAENKFKIEKITVGIHFYQTHPDFIKEFINYPNVHFIQQPEGTFHPKVYLFSNSESDWELIIGSANFTASAFSKNTEASLLVSHQDINAIEVYNTALEIIDSSFNKGKVFTITDWENYSKIWNIHQSKIKSLSGQYGSAEDKSKPIFKIEFTTRTWSRFIEKVNEERFHALEKRLRVIEIAQELFKKVDHFNDLEEDERKFIAGIPNKLDVSGSSEWGYFGSMQGAGKFKNKIKDNNELISKALDQIPLIGQVTKRHYDRYVHYYKQALPGNYLATSTRLLAMKRPDVFVCYDSKNNKALCEDFGITKKDQMNNERYWEEIVMRIFDSEWWCNPTPKNEIERKISLARSAFLDSLYYNE